MSFTDKHKYSLYEAGYGKDVFYDIFYMSQFPSNEEIFEALCKNNFFGGSAQYEEYKFERVNDKWFKPNIKVYLLDESPRLIWEIRP